MQAFCLKPVGEIDWRTHQVHADNNLAWAGRGGEICGLAIPD
jgi:hypothetical protein